MSKFMTHTDYSNWVIMKHAERAIAGKYPSLTAAFNKAAKVLKCRPTQVASRYHKLKHDGHTADDFKDFTQADIDGFDPGQSEKIIRSYDKGRTGGPHGEHFKGTGEKEEKEADDETAAARILNAPPFTESKKEEVPYNQVKLAETKEDPNPDDNDSYKKGYATAVEQAIKSLLLRSSKELKISIVKHIMKDL